MPEFAEAGGHRFEVFERALVGNRDASEPPAVTVRKSGDFELNKRAFAALGGPAAVTLAYAEDEGPVGFAPAD